MFGRRKNSDVGTVTTTYTETTSRRPSVNYILASLLTLAGAVLLWLCAFSTPFIRSIYYIGLRGGDADRLGTFGYCVRRGSIRCIQKVGVSRELLVSFAMSSWPVDLPRPALCVFFPLRHSFCSTTTPSSPVTLTVSPGP